MTLLTRVFILFASIVSTYVLGFTFGMLLGLSNSPVVSVALPLIFSIAGGASGLYMGAFDFDDALTPFRIGVLTVAITFLSAGTLVGVWLGISQRAPSVERWSIVTSDVEGNLRGTGQSDVIEQLLVDENLFLMGLDKNERKIVHQTLILSKTEQDPALGRLTLSLRLSFDSALPPEDRVEHFGEWALAEIYLSQIEVLLTLPQSNKRQYELVSSIDEFANQLGLLRDDEDDIEYLNESPSADIELKRVEKTVVSLKLAVNSESAFAVALEKLNSRNTTAMLKQPSRGLASDAFEVVPTG